MCFLADMMICHVCTRHSCIKVPYLQELLSVGGAPSRQVSSDLFQARQGGIASQWQDCQNSYWVHTVCGLHHSPYRFLQDAAFRSLNAALYTTLQWQD